MIASSIYAKDNLNQYPSSIRKAIRYVMEHDFNTMADGEYLIEGRQIYAKVFEITAKQIAETNPEIHKEYIDVQFWVNGGEMLGFAPLKEAYEVIEAHPEQDLYFLGKIKDETFFKVVEGDYVVFFPNDIHRPGITDSEPLRCRKVVVKVHVDTLQE